MTPVEKLSRVMATRAKRHGIHLDYKALMPVVRESLSVLGEPSDLMVDAGAEEFMQAVCREDTASEAVAGIFEVMIEKALYDSAGQPLPEPPS